LAFFQIVVGALTNNVVTSQVVLPLRCWLRQPGPTGKRRWPPRQPATPRPGTSPPHRLRQVCRPQTPMDFPASVLARGLVLAGLYPPATSARIPE